jgi:hypothetical protein
MADKRIYCGIKNLSQKQLQNKRYGNENECFDSRQLRLWGKYAVPDALVERANKKKVRKNKIQKDIESFNIYLDKSFDRKKPLPALPKKKKPLPSIPKKDKYSVKNFEKFLDDYDLSKLNRKNYDLSKLKI